MQPNKHKTVFIQKRISQNKKTFRFITLKSTIKSKRQDKNIFAVFSKKQNYTEKQSGKVLSEN